MAKHTHATKKTAVDLYLAGATCDQVGAQVGAAPSTVLAWVRKAGHAVRPAKRPAMVNGSPTVLVHGRWVRDGLVWRYEVAA